MKKSRLSVRAKITLGYTLLVVLMIIIALTSIFRVTTLVASLQSVESFHGVKQTYAINLRESVNERATLLRDIILIDNASEVPALVDRMKLIKGDYDKSLQLISQLVKSRADEITPKEQDLLKRIETLHQQSNPLIEEIIELRLNRNYAQAEQMMMGQARPLFSRWLNEINTLINEQEKISVLETQQTVESAITLQKVMWGLLAISILLSLTLAFLLARSIARALGDEPSHVTQIAGEIASGNLAIDIPSENAMPGSVISAIGNMRDGLSHMIANVRDSADHIEHASEQIEGANIVLSQRAEEQAESLEQIAQAMKHLTQIVSTNTQNARQATEKAQSTSEDAVKGGEVIHQMVTTMSSINDSSRKVSDITTVIDSIAFQTNILALNAAVEAARAGEHGRGFAVVASEVRSLAQRSATAAKEIATLINNSVSEVDNGNQLAMQASQSINDIVNSVHEVTAIIAQITTSSETQMTGITQVDGLIQQMNSITHMNVDMVKQANVASHTLKEQVIGLGKWISAFKMKDSLEYKKTHPFFANLDSIETDLEDALLPLGKEVSSEEAHLQNTRLNSTKAVSTQKDTSFSKSMPKASISHKADKPTSAIGSEMATKTSQVSEVSSKSEFHSELKRPKVYNLGGQEVKTPVGQVIKKKTEIISDHDEWEEF